MGASTSRRAAGEDVDLASRRVTDAAEQSALRQLTSGAHPDHDTICKFRRENFEAFRGSFVDVLELARELKLLKLGNVSLDGTPLTANASIDPNVSYQRAVDADGSQLVVGQHVSQSAGD